MFESYNNPYNLYGGIYNPYYSQQSQLQQAQKQNLQMYKQPGITGLQGKVVDSLDVVKATDIPYDGSVSYFPLTDGTAIITKQLQQDGTSRVIVYKPISEKEDIKPKYITENEFQEIISNMNNKYITENDLKEQIKDLNNKDIKDIKEDIKTLKRKLEDITDDIKDKKEK